MPPPWREAPKQSKGDRADQALELSRQGPRSGSFAARARPGSGPGDPEDFSQNLPKGRTLPRPPNVALLKALWSLLDGIWGLLKGSWGVLVGACRCR